jgi:DNA polymerase/3'-5' exonuclease PolX
MMSKQRRKALGFFTGKDGKTHPITKSDHQLNRKRIVKNSRSFKGVSPGNEITRLAKREYAFLHRCAKRIDLAGSIRRKKPNPSDIDIVMIPKSAAAKQAIYKHAGQYKVRARGEKLLSYWLLPRKRAQVDIYFAKPQHYGAMLLFSTGPGEYNIALRAKAIAQGLRLNQYGVFKGNKCLGSKTEREVYDALLYPYKSPELRGLSDKEAGQRFGAKPGQRIIRGGGISAGEDGGKSKGVKR